MQKDIPAILGAMRKIAGRQAIVSSKDPFKVLIATVLSQRTRDENTAKAAKQLFEKHATARALSNAPLKKIRKLVKPAGFYRVKAARIREISRLLLERFQGRVPEKMEELLSLPGVGRKTANCVLVYGFGRPAMPTDTHVHRISNRIGLVETGKPEQTELALIRVIPKRNWIELNHLMVSYGQAVCLPRNPKCRECEIRAECRHFSSVAGKKQV